MPGRNVVKQFEENTYYHVYNCGVDQRQIFVDDQDYKFFLDLLARHLGQSTKISKRGHEYESYYGRVELLAFCLTPNNFNLLLYLNIDIASITELMRRVSGSYTTYFNLKYKRVGHLFQGVYKASKITTEQYVLHVSRYIHRLPDDYYNWPYSSLPYYIKNSKDDWVVPDKVYRLYDWGTYEAFLNDYGKDKENDQKMLTELADKNHKSS